MNLEILENNIKYKHKFEDFFVDVTIIEIT